MGLLHNAAVLDALAGGLADGAVLLDGAAILNTALLVLLGLSCDCAVRHCDSLVLCEYKDQFVWICVDEFVGLLMLPLVRRQIQFGQAREI